jgi:drug/metabolite transporter (DMT)-like permease
MRRTPAEPNLSAGCVLITSMAGDRNSRAVPIAVLLLLSLLWACGVLRPLLISSTAFDLLPHYERQALPFALLAGMVGAVALLRPAPSPRGPVVRNSLLVGLGLFIAPTAIIDFAASSTTAVTRTALLTLVPLFAAVFEPYIGQSDSRQQSRNGLLATLVGVCGALCVFPAKLPESIGAAGAFCAVIVAAACVAAANCKSVTVAQECPDSLPTMAAIAAVLTAVAEAGASVALEHPVLVWGALWPSLLWSAAIDVPVLLLLFWLMPRLSAPRMATRYLLGPLIAVAVGAVLIRSPLAWRTWLGLTLMSAAAVYLLLAPDAKPESTGLALN